MKIRISIRVVEGFFFSKERTEEKIVDIGERIIWGCSVYPVEPSGKLAVDLRTTEPEHATALYRGSQHTVTHHVVFDAMHKKVSNVWINRGEDQVGTPTSILDIDLNPNL